MSYLYSQINRLEEPHHYMYTPLQGEELLQSYVSSRAAVARRRYAATGESVGPDSMLVICALPILEKLFDATLPESGTKFRALCGCEAVQRHKEEEGSVEALAKGLEQLTIVESVTTLDLLHALIAVQLTNTRDANTKVWLDRLVQRFEVTKKIYESYLPSFRKGEGTSTSVRLYWLFAVALSLFYARSNEIKYLSALLKVCDLLCSLPENGLQGQIPEHGLSMVLATEIVSVQLLAEKKECHLRLSDIGMIAADTSRSRAYLQALARNELLPNYVLVLGHASHESLPGQLDKSLVDFQTKLAVEVDACWSESNFDATRPIMEQLEELDISYDVSMSKDINEPSVIEAISRRPESVFIYSGFGGALLRKDILATGKQFLHVHGGYLPDYKGSTTNYYSLLVNNTLGASSLFLSEKIDSGPVLLRRKFSPPANRQAIDHIYDSAARAKILVETLQNYLKHGGWEFELSANTGGETYYIIHPVLKHIAILAKGQSI